MKKQKKIISHLILIPLKNICSLWNVVNLEILQIRQQQRCSQSLWGWLHFVFSCFCAGLFRRISKKMAYIFSRSRKSSSMYTDNDSDHTLVSQSHTIGNHNPSILTPKQSTQLRLPITIVESKAAADTLSDVSAAAPSVCMFLFSNKIIIIQCWRPWCPMLFYAN